MTRQPSKIIAAAKLLHKIQGKDSDQTKNIVSALSTILCFALLCAVLGGCATKEPVGKIRLYPDTIGVASGQTVVLKAKHSPFDRKKDWLYQWQIITGEADDGNINTTNIPDAHCNDLVLKKVGLDDAALYRCMIYRPGKFPETNYTAVFSLHVSQISLTLSGVITTVSGSFKPGQGSGTSPKCGILYKDGIVFQSPNGNWWLPPGNSPTPAMITDNTTGINYATTPVYFQVWKVFTPLNNCCWKLPKSASLMQFPVDPSSGYMFCLYFPGPLPPAGAKFSFAVKW